MTKQTAIHRIGNIILWLGTIFLVACMAASAGYAHYYLLGTLESPQSLLWVAGCLAALGIISWLVFASIAYIFNGRTPLAVICGRSRKANVSSLILVSFFSGGMLALMIGIHYLFRTDLGPQLMFWFIWTIVWTFFIGRVAFEREQRLEQEQRLQQEQWMERQDWERRFPR